MKKLINGQVVDITPDVLVLFEKAMEGNVTKKALSSRIDIALKSDVQGMGDIISAYYTAYLKLPYPLYTVEEEIKYALIEVEMQRKLKKTLGYIPRIKVVDNKVSVYSESGFCVELASDSWAITVEEFDGKGNGIINIDDYKLDQLYRFYSWCNNKFISNVALNNFYSFAIPGVLNACGRKALIVKWELIKLLQFNAVPSKAKLSSRHFIDVDSGADYVVDVYWGGEYLDSGRKVWVIDTRKNAENVLTEMKSSKKFEYDVFENNKENGRVKLKASKRRFDGVFNAIVDMCNSGYDIDSLEYKGIISDGYIAMEINNHLYAGTISDGIREIGRETSIVSLNDNRLYVSKNIKKPTGAVREAIYIYDIDKDVLKVCDVRYEKEANRIESM